MDFSLLGFIVGALVGIATIVGVVYTVRANRIAQKSLEVQHKQELRQQSNLELYLFEGYFIRLRKQQLRIYVFRVRVTNQSDAVNSLKEATLTIEYSQGDQSPFNFNIPADSSLLEWIEDRKLSVLNIPSVIEQHATVSGHLLFKIPETVLHDANINAYSVTITDERGIPYQLHPIFVNEG